MKVKDLVEQLKNMDGEAEVLLSTDEEGNEYKPVYKVTPASEITMEDLSVIVGCIIIWP